MLELKFIHVSSYMSVAKLKFANGPLVHKIMSGVINDAI